MWTERADAGHASRMEQVQMAGPARKTPVTRKATTQVAKPPVATRPVAPRTEEPPTMPTAIAEPETVSSMFEVVTEPVAKRNVASKLNNELLTAMRISYKHERRFSMKVEDTPKSTRDGITTQNVKTAGNYIRRHAAALGYGVSIVPLAEDRVSFLAQPKREVPSGDARKPRTRNSDN